jgi:hypothetical protein
MMMMMMMMMKHGRQCLMVSRQWRMLCNIILTGTLVS